MTAGASLDRYDPLALMAVLPCHAHYFSFERVTVDDTTHRVLGMDEERTGINPETKAELVQHLYTAFLQVCNHCVTTRRKTTASPAPLTLLPHTRRASTERSARSTCCRCEM
jgi:hypothetical protein